MSCHENLYLVDIRFYTHLWKNYCTQLHHTVTFVNVIELDMSRFHYCSKAHFSNSTLSLWFEFCSLAQEKWAVNGKVNAPIEIKTSWDLLSLGIFLVVSGKKSKVTTKPLWYGKLAFFQIREGSPFSLKKCLIGTLKQLTL